MVVQVGGGNDVRAVPRAGSSGAGGGSSEAGASGAAELARDDSVLTPSSSGPLPSQSELASLAAEAELGQQQLEKAAHEYAEQAEKCVRLRNELVRLATKQRKSAKELESTFNALRSGSVGSGGSSGSSNSSGGGGGGRKAGNGESAAMRLPAADASATTATPSSSPSATSGGGYFGRRRSSALDARSAETYRGQIAAVKRSMKWVDRLLPSDGGLFVRAFLGSLDVRFIDKKTRLTFKSEYERFKQHTAPTLVVASLLCLVWTRSRWPSLLLQLYIAFYYSALALRENVLVVNGSNIKLWWRLHHMLSLALATCVLTWPDGAAYAESRFAVHFLGLYMSLLQILQARYQMARLYTLRSLGKAGELDVANTDSSAQLHWSASMRTLVPFIVVGHGVQLWAALRAFNVFRRHPGVVQALLCGVLIFATFVGNLLTTARTLREKVVVARQHAE